MIKSVTTVKTNNYYKVLKIFYIISKDFANKIYRFTFSQRSNVKRHSLYIYLYNESISRDDILLANKDIVS